MTITISERNIVGIRQFAGLTRKSFRQELYGLRGAEDVEFVTPMSVPGLSVLDFAKTLYDAGYFGQEGEGLTDEWNVALAAAFNNWWDEVVIGGAFGVIASPDSHYPEIYITEDKRFVAVLGHITNPDGTVGEDVLDVLISFAGNEAALEVVHIPYHPREAEVDQDPTPVPGFAPAPTPPKPPSRRYASVFGWGAVAVGSLYGIWHLIKNSSRRR